jgi:N-methylhydantoinase B
MPDAGSRALDPITLEVVRHRLQHVVQEMSSAIVKTAVSPVVSEARDFSCILYDADGHVVATASTVPFHFGVCAEAVAGVARRFGKTIGAGDVFFANDPHDGGGLHLQDVVVMRPIHRKRLRLGWTSTSGHMVDMGGMVPGSFAPSARECFQEGLRLPPVRLARRGEPADDVWRTILNNVREPETVEMDLKSLVAGTHVAEQQLLALADEYGAVALGAAFRAIRRGSGRVLAERIGALPEGEYVHQGWSEFDAEAFLVRCTLRIRDGVLEFDYAGSSPQCPYFFNSRPAIVRSELVVRVHQLLAADVPFTDGILEPVRVVAPEGSIVNARPPAPIAAAHMHVGLMAMELGETCLKKALACARPHGAAAALQRRITAPGGTTGMGLSSWHGITRAGVAESFLAMDGNAVGAGACADRDGIDMTGSDYGGPGLVYPDVETVEQTYPVLYLYKRLRADAGGSGRQRGGASVDAAFAAHGTSRLEGTTLGMRRAVPLPGLFGGYPGSCTQFEVRRGAGVGRDGVPSSWDAAGGTPESVGLNQVGIALAEGDAFRFANASGSGLGDPLLRDPAAVAGDVGAGYVTAETARSVYGVVLHGGAVDDAATTLARDAVRAARRARAAFPSRSADPPRNAAVVGRLADTVEVVRVAAGLAARCAACGAGLAIAPGGWKGGAGVAETVLGTPEYRARAGTWAPRRAEGVVLMREYVCPGCAGLLDVDVAVEGVPREDDVRPRFWTGTGAAT